MDAQANASDRALRDQSAYVSVLPLQLLDAKALRRPIEFTPYASEDYRAALTANSMLASMSRKGDCWDNAVAESFISTLKTEALSDHVPADHAAVSCTSTSTGTTT